MFRMPSPALAVSIVALLIALGGAGYSATGGNFILGVANNASSRTILTSNANDRVLQLNNSNSTGAATALYLNVAPGRPPLAVSSTARVANLNADFLDGLDSSTFARKVGEGWNYVGDPGKAGFENGWGNFNGPGLPHNTVTNQHAAYRQDNFGVIHLGGLVASGTIGQPIFTLPASHCPFFTKVFPAISNNAFSRITINKLSNGCAVFANFGSSTWVSLEGVSFLNATLEQAIN